MTKHNSFVAIHQPNLFPRMATLAKLFASDLWVVLDNVQFSRRDYQHRMWMSPLAEPASLRLLTLPVHLVAGRATLIREVELVDLQRALGNFGKSTQHLYGRSQYWPEISNMIGEVRAATSGPHLDPLAITSTLAMLRFAGWSGRVVHASSLGAASADRNRRLVDLCRRVGAQTFLCGTGGRSYLDTVLFESAGIDVHVVADSAQDSERRRSSLDVLARCGPYLLAQWISGAGDYIRDEGFSERDWSARTYVVDWARLIQPARPRRRHGGNEVRW